MDHYHIAFIGLLVLQICLLLAGIKYGRALGRLMLNWIVEDMIHADTIEKRRVKQVIRELSVLKENQLPEWINEKLETFQRDHIQVALKISDAVKPLE